jgi:hypothetical protein
MDAPAPDPAPEPPGLLSRALMAYQQCFQFSLYWLRQTLCCGACLGCASDTAALVTEHQSRTAHC